MATDKEQLLLNAIDRAEETAYGSDEKGELSSARSLAIDMYLGRNTRPAPEGRSQVVDRSVFETINWILPSIVDIFANGDDVVKIGPIGEEDVPGAEQESDFINHVMLNKTPWLMTVMTLFIDSALTKNAYVYTYKDYRRNVSIDSYEGQTKMGLQMLLDGGNSQIIKQKEYPDPSGEMEPVMGPDGQPAMQVMGVDPVGQPIMQPAMQPVMLYDVTIRTVETEGQYCIDVLPPEHCKVSDSTKSFQLDGCPYFEYGCEKTISDLRKMGFDVEDDIASAEEDDTEEDQARDQFNETNEGDTEYEPSMRKVWVRTIWIEHDYDEDGIAELQKIIRVGDTILDREEVSRINVRSTVSMLLPHRHPGLSISDIVKDLQEIKTAILRGGLDNLYLSNNSRMAVSNKVNLDDVLLSRPGQPIRVDTDMADAGAHVFPVQTPFIFPQAMEGLSYMDSVKQTRTGINSQFQGLDASQLTQLQPGTVNQISSMAAQRVKLLARIFGMCIEGIASDLHECILKSGHKKETVQLKGKWVEVDPASWKKRKDFKTVVGYAAGNKDSMIAKLMMIASAQEKAMMGGLPIVSPENMYNTAQELTKASDFPPDRFFTHPSKIPPKGPPQPDVTVIAAEQIKSQTALKAKDMDVSQKATENATQLELEKYKIDTDAKVKLTIAQSQFDHDSMMRDKDTQVQFGMKKFEKDLENEPALEVNGKVDEMAGKVSALEDSLKDGIQALQEALTTILTAKRVVKRGKDGKAEGIDITLPGGAVIASQRVMRDKGGKIVGAE
jgi:hypothetical protein